MIYLGAGLLCWRGREAWAAEATLEGSCPSFSTDLRTMLDDDHFTDSGTKDKVGVVGLPVVNGVRFEVEGNLCDGTTERGIIVGRTDEMARHLVVCLERVRHIITREFGEEALVGWANGPVFDGKIIRI